MSKEARYAYERKHSRLARLHERVEHYCAQEEASVPLHLRKKFEQGKGMEGPPAA